jgi:hypothetical protein
MPFFYLYAAHIYVTVLTRSSSGEDRMHWPSETYTDWFGEAALVLGVGLTWSSLVLIPSGMAFHEISPRWGLATWLALLWLVVPISLCSALAGPSRLLFVYPPLIGRLVRQWKALLFVQFISLQLFWVVLIGFWLIVVKQNALGIVIVGMALPPALMVHARAWGRLAWLALNCDLPVSRGRRTRKLIRKEEPLEVDLELVDDGDDIYTLQPVRAAVGERLITMTEIETERIERDRLRCERLGLSDPLEPPRAPTFDTALGPHAFRFLADHDTLSVWVGFGLMCLVEAALVFFVVSAS